MSRDDFLKWDSGIMGIVGTLGSGAFTRNLSIYLSIPLTWTSARVSAERGRFHLSTMGKKVARPDPP